MMYVGTLGRVCRFRKATSARLTYFSLHENDIDHNNDNTPHEGPINRV